MAQKVVLAVLDRFEVGKDHFTKEAFVSLVFGNGQ
eukprot:gene36241-44704_t